MGYEANPLMKYMTQHPLMAIGFKVLFPGLMLLLIWHLIKSLSGKEYIKALMCILIPALAYTFINCMHIYNTYLIFVKWGGSL